MNSVLGVLNQFYSKFEFRHTKETAQQLELWNLWPEYRSGNRCVPMFPCVVLMCVIAHLNRADSQSVESYKMPNRFNYSEF